MSKRKSEETKEEKWRRKMKKYEMKLMQRRIKNSQRIIYSDEEDDAIIEEHLDVEIPYDSPSNTFMGPNQSLSHEYHNTLTENCSNAEPQLFASGIDDIPALDADVDHALLGTLGELQTETLEWGDDILEDISKRLQPILQQGLNKEIREELEKKYLFPKNVPLAKAPLLNPEINAMMTESSKNRDKRILLKQNQLGRALSSLGNAMTCLVKKNPDLSNVLKILNDTCKLIADSHYAETETRRSLITPLVDKSLIDSFKGRKRDNFLFGDKLGDLVKNSRGIRKIGQSIQSQSSTMPNSSLNWRGPPPRNQTLRGRRINRAGGQLNLHPYPNQSQYAQRRRVQLPPPTRRQPPPATTSAHRVPPMRQSARIPLSTLGRQQM